MKMNFQIFVFVALIGTDVFATTSERDSYREKMATTIDTIIKSKSIDGKSGYDNSVQLKTGMVQYEQEGLIETKEAETSETPLDISTGEAATATLEFSWYSKRNFSTTLGYRFVHSSDIGRTLYQSGYGGLRYFPYTNGAPTEFNRELNHVFYDFKFKPYLETGVSLGRYLVAVFGEAAALDISSEFVGANAGIGAIVPITQRLALDTSATYEYSYGYGPILFSSHTFFFLTGLTYFY
jgi:hypothetical protein